MAATLNLGIVGYGQSAVLMHAGFVAQPGVAVRWVIGRLPEPTAQFAAERGIAHHGVDLEAALADETLDAIVICTPHALHYTQALRALQAGKHAIVEVPLTLSYAEACHLVEVAAAGGRQLSIPHISRYLPMYVEAQQRLQAGELGRVFQFIYRRLWLQRGIGNMLKRQRSWLDTVSWHHAAHPVDLAMWLLGEPMQCVSAVIGRDRQSNKEVDLSTHFVMPSGTIITLTLSYNARQDFLDTVIIGEHSLLEFQGFSALRRSGEVLLQPTSAIEVQSLAYERYIAAAVAGLRGAAPMPVTGAEILPVMEQLQRMHDLAAGAPAPVLTAAH